MRSSRPQMICTGIVRGAASSAMPSRWRPFGKPCARRAFRARPARRRAACSASTSSTIARLTSAGSCTSRLSTSCISRRRCARTKPSMKAPLISGPSPAGAIRVSAATRSGCAMREMTRRCAPPIEWPTRCTLSMPSAASASADDRRPSVSASPAPTSLAEPPWPGRSSAIARRRLGQRRLGEHPGVEVGAKAVHEQDRDARRRRRDRGRAAAAAGFDVARRRAGVFGGGFGGRLGRDEAGDKGVDLGIGHVCRERRPRAARRSARSRRPAPRCGATCRLRRLRTHW